MSSKKFNLLTRTSDSDDISAALKGYYSNWRTVNRAMNAPFLAIYNSFKDKHLSSLEAGPLRLYLYFAFHANNDTGHSWHSIQTIAKFFETQTRTIDNWIKVLVDKNLIYRERTDKLSHTTFLIPYSNTIVAQKPSKKHKSDNQELLDDILSIITKRKALYGEIINVYHLFQWKTKSGKVIPEDAFQMILILTRRNDGIIVGHFYILTRLEDYGISEIEVEDIATFSSHFVYKDEPIKGVALNPSISIRSRKNAKVLLDLCEQLAEAQDIDFDLHLRVNYGLISEVLEEVPEEESEEQETE